MADKFALEDEAIQCRIAGNIQSEVEKLNEALALDPGFVRAHLALAIAYIKLGQFAEAVGHAEKAAELEPNDAFNFTSLSVIYQRVFAGTRDTSFIQRAEDARDRAHYLKHVSG